MSSEVSNMQGWMNGIFEDPPVLHSGPDAPARQAGGNLLERPGTAGRARFEQAHGVTVRIAFKISFEETEAQPRDKAANGLIAKDTTGNKSADNDELIKENLHTTSAERYMYHSAEFRRQRKPTEESPSIHGEKLYLNKVSPVVVNKTPEYKSGIKLTPSREHHQLHIDPSLLNPKFIDLSRGSSDFGNNSEVSDVHTSDDIWSSEDIEIITGRPTPFDKFLASAGIKKPVDSIRKVLLDAGIKTWTDLLPSMHMTESLVMALGIEKIVAGLLLAAASERQASILVGRKTCLKRDRHYKSRLSSKPA
ncbi:hypothetical protein DFH28DRAFT_1078170 [Melampsora americana]|nr:hypothetical protein DFH28DRAFT_1078170 [Melampsora americana]